MVLGPVGLVDVAPTVLRAVVRAPYAIVLLQQGVVSTEVEERWRRAGVGEFLPSDRIASRIEQAIEAPVRLHLPTEAWLPQLGGQAPRIRRALDLVPDLLPHTVEAWAHALGCNRRTVLTLCRRALRMRSEDVLWAWRDAVVRHERLRRVSTLVIARLARYGSRSALYRAYKRRGIPFPPAGAGNGGDPPSADPVR